MGWNSKPHTFLLATYSPIILTFYFTNLKVSIPDGETKTTK